MSLFDDYKKIANIAVTGIMGTACVWIPSDNSVPAGLRTNVLFKNPTKEEKLNGVEFNPYVGQIEFYDSELQGLAIAVRGGNQETITLTIDGEDLVYLVESVNSKWDGDISMAEIVLAEQ